MQEYSEKERQDYVDWMNIEKEARKNLMDQLNVARGTSEESGLLEKLGELFRLGSSGSGYCLHERSLCSNCIACDELNRLCFSRYCECGKLAIGLVNNYGAKDNEFFCEEHSKDVDNFEPYEEE